MKLPLGSRCVKYLMFVFNLLFVVSNLHFFILFSRCKWPFKATSMLFTFKFLKHSYFVIQIYTSYLRWDGEKTFTPGKFLILNVFLLDHHMESDRFFLNSCVVFFLLFYIFYTDISSKQIHIELPFKFLIIYCNYKYYVSYCFRYTSISLSILPPPIVLM